MGQTIRKKSDYEKIYNGISITVSCKCFKFQLQIIFPKGVWVALVCRLYEWMSN